MRVDIPELMRVKKTEGPSSFIFLPIALNLKRPLTKFLIFYFMHAWGKMRLSTSLLVCHSILHSLPRARKNGFLHNRKGREYLSTPHLDFVCIMCTPTPYTPCSNASSSSLKSREIHHIPARATATYMILASTVPAPPLNHATRSKENRPTKPQLSVPIMAIARAILFMIVI